MTVVLAAMSKDGKQAGIATDKMVFSWTKSKLATGKILRKPGVLFGYCGSFEGASAFKQWDSPRRFHGEDHDEYVLRLEASLRKHMKAEAVNLKEIDGVLLYNARIYCVQEAQMFEVEDKFSVGSGMYTAIGALEAARALSPNMSLQKQLELAIQITNDTTVGCGFGSEVVLQTREP